MNFKEHREIITNFNNTFENIEEECKKLNFDDPIFRNKLFEIVKQMNDIAGKFRLLFYDTQKFCDDAHKFIIYGSDGFIWYVYSSFEGLEKELKRRGRFQTNNEYRICYFGKNDKIFHIGHVIIENDITEAKYTFENQENFNRFVIKNS